VGVLDKAFSLMTNSFCTPSDVLFNPLPVKERSIVMIMSVLLCLSMRELISGTAHLIFFTNFRACYLRPWIGSFLAALR